MWPLNGARIFSLKLTPFSIESIGSADVFFNCCPFMTSLIQAMQKAARLIGGVRLCPFAEQNRVLQFVTVRVTRLP